MDESYINSEKEIFKSQVEKEDKPDEIKEKMIQGRLNKQLADVSLLKQAFVKDPSKTVEAFLLESNAKISSFIRLNFFIPDSRIGWNYFAFKKAFQKQLTLMATVYGFGCRAKLY